MGTFVLGIKGEPLVGKINLKELRGVKGNAGVPGRDGVKGEPGKKESQSFIIMNAGVVCVINYVRMSFVQIII